MRGHKGCETHTSLISGVTKATRAKMYLSTSSSSSQHMPACIKRLRDARAHAKCKYSQSERNSPFVHSFIKIKAIKVHLKRNTHISRGVHTFAYHGMGDQVRLGLLEMFTQPIKKGSQKCVEAKRLLHNRSSLNLHNRGLYLRVTQQWRATCSYQTQGELFIYSVFSLSLD